MDLYGFYTGTVMDAWQYLGAHLESGGVVFRTFAPNAAGVSLLHQGREIPMSRILDGNFYEVMVPGAEPGDRYEYRIYHRQNGWTDHCDPYGFAMELRPNHRSIVRGLSDYTFHDENWMRHRDTAETKPKTSG